MRNWLLVNWSKSLFEIEFQTLGEECLIDDAFFCATS